jgi:16S rRNA (guanine527-N7)-methyltransferase
VFPTRLWPAGVAEPEASQLEALARFLSDVLDGSTRVNLTSVSDPAEAWVVHVVDSVSVVPEVDAAPPGQLVDVGSGAGFPGVPLAVVTGRRTTLAESRRKKAEFLRRHAETLPGARIRVVGERSEELARAEPESFSVVTSRAVAALPVVLELSQPLLRRGGRVVAMKGGMDPEEAAAGLRAGRILGLEQVTDRTYDLPGKDAERRVIVYEKRGESEVSLPRRPGMAKKRPLA